MSCPFCTGIDNRSVASNDYAHVIFDGFPVTVHHSLIIPKRHVADYFDLTDEELKAIQSLMSEHKSYLQKIDPSIKGFNIGVNVGSDAGQTVFHCHIHLIPRRHADVEDPRGGVRGVIPSKQRY